MQEVGTVANRPADGTHFPATFIGSVKWEDELFLSFQAGADIGLQISFVAIVEVQELDAEFAR